MLASVLRNLVTVWGSYRASKKMHARLLDHVLLLPMAFFDSQPLGRLLNRFTKDTEAVDVELLHLVCGTAPSQANHPLPPFPDPPPLPWPSDFDTPFPSCSLPSVPSPPRLESSPPLSVCFKLT